MNRAVAPVILLLVTLAGVVLAYQLASERWHQLTLSSAAAGLVSGLAFMILLDLAASRHHEAPRVRPLGPRVSVDREMLATELALAEIRLFDSVADAADISAMFGEDRPDRSLAQVDFLISDSVRALAYHAGILHGDKNRGTRELVDELIGRGVITFGLAKPLNAVLSTIEHVKSGAEIDHFDAAAVVRAGRRIIVILQKLRDRFSG